MKRNRIPRSYRKAFLMLAQTLVYIPDSISNRAVSLHALSRKLQNQFVDLYIAEAEKGLKTMIARHASSPEESAHLLLKAVDPSCGILAEIEIPIEKEIFDLGKLATFETTLKLSPLAFMHKIPIHIGGNVLGFTPALAVDNSYRCHVNCFGNAIAIGSYCRKKGIKVELGITADHPLVFAYLPDGVYVLNHVYHTDQKTLKLKGRFEKYDSYKIYYPLEGELPPYRMIMLHPFDDAIFYEILENVEALRRISLGLQEAVPDTELTAESVTKQYKAVLELADWKEMQAILWPHIANSFCTHHGRWQREIERVTAVRNIHRLESYLREPIAKAFKSTSLHEMDLKEGHDIFINDASMYIEDIMLFLWGDIAFSETIPSDIRNYFQVFKTEIEKIGKPNVSEDIYKGIDIKLRSVQSKEKSEYFVTKS